MPNDATTWHRSAEWLRPGVRTVFEMVNDHVPRGGSPRTASRRRGDRPRRRLRHDGAAARRRAASRPPRRAWATCCPDPARSPFLSEPAHLDDPYFRWGVQVDDLGLQQVLELWAGRGVRAGADLVGAASSPTPVTTAAGRGRSWPARRCGSPTPGSSRSSTTSTGSGCIDEVTFLLTADHGFEGADPDRHRLLAAGPGRARPALPRRGARVRLPALSRPLAQARRPWPRESGSPRTTPPTRC